jgi:hypothetical protein
VQSVNRLSPLSAFDAAGLSEYVRRHGEIVINQARTPNEDVAFFCGRRFFIAFR